MGRDLRKIFFNRVSGFSAIHEIIVFSPSFEERGSKRVVRVGKPGQTGQTTRTEAEDIDQPQRTSFA